MAGTEIERLFYTVEADISRLGKELKKSERVAKKSSSRIKRSLDSIGKSSVGLERKFGGLRGAAVAAAGVAGLGLLVKAAFQASDTIADTAEKLGLGIEELQEYRFAARQAGIDVNQFDISLQRLTRRVAEATNGTGEALNTLIELQIPLKNMDGTIRGTGDILLDLADKFSLMNDEARQVLASFKLFDTEGVNNVRILNKGADALRASRKQAQSMGAVIRKDLVLAGAKANDEITALGDALKASFQVGVMDGFAEAFGDIEEAASSPELRDAMTQIGMMVGALAAFSVQHAPALIRLFTALAGAGVGATIGATLAPVTGGLSIPIGAAAGGLAGAFAPELLGVDDLTVSLGLATAAAQALGVEAEAIQRINDELDRRERNQGLRGRARAVADIQTPAEFRGRGTKGLQREAIERQLAVGAARRQLTTPRAVKPRVDPESTADKARDALKAAAAAEKLASARERAQKQIDNLAQSLRDELTVLQAETSERDALRTILAAENTLRAVGQTLTKEQREEIQKLVDAVEEETEAQEGLEAILQDIRTPLDDYNDRLELANKLLREGKLSAEQYGLAVAKAQQDLQDAGDSTNDLADAAGNFANIVTSGFEDAIINGEKLGDVVRALEQDLIRLIFRVSVTKPLENLITGQDGGGGIEGLITSLVGGIIGSIGGGGGPAQLSGAGAGGSSAAGSVSLSGFAPGGGSADIGAGGFLAGGRVGEGGGVRRSVNPLAFLGAPSMERGGVVGRQPSLKRMLGLRSGEVPIIAHRGETVTPAGQRTGDTIVNMMIPPSMDTRGMRQAGASAAATVHRFISSRGARFA